MRKETPFNALKKGVFVGLALAFISYNSIAQFTLSGELRPRTEYRRGYKMLPVKDQDAAIFTDQRTRLNAAYLTEGYKVKISLQDIRTWGSQPQLNTTDGLTSVHEAWGEAFLHSKFSFKFGRQEIIYDDHRIFGNVGWAQQARSHDAGIFKYNDSTFTAHLGFAYNQDRPSLSGTTAKNGSYKSFQYLWLNKNFGTLDGSFLFLNNGKQVTKPKRVGPEEAYDNYSQTAGVRLTYKREKLTVHVAGYYQMGVDGDTLNSKIAAYNASADVSYQLAEKFALTAGIELLSGNSETEACKDNKAFNPFYGTNHKFNGLMDYFYVGNHAGSVGLNDFFIKGKYKHEKAFVGGDVHFFMANNDVLDDKELASSGKITNGSTYLGTEVDLYGGFNLSKGVALKVGYSHLMASNSMVSLKGGDKDEVSNWGWVMIIIKPVFIDGKNKE